MGPKGKQFASKLMAVDKLHFRFVLHFLGCMILVLVNRGHRGEYCQKFCDPWKLKELDGVNTPVCEQVFLALTTWRAILTNLHTFEILSNFNFIFYIRRSRGWTALLSVAGWMRPGFFGDCLFKDFYFCFVSSIDILQVLHVHHWPSEQCKGEKAACTAGYYDIFHHNLQHNCSGIFLVFLKLIHSDPACAERKKYCDSIPKITISSTDSSR